MGMLDGLIEQLEKSPMVETAMKQIHDFRQILVATVNRFDSRFGEAEKLQVALAQSNLRIEQNLDNLLSLLNYGIAPAGEHVLELPLDVQVSDCPVVGCKVVGIHDHGDGEPVQVSHEQSGISVDNESITLIH